MTIRTGRILRSRALQIQDQHSDILHERRKVEARIMCSLPPFELGTNASPEKYHPKGPSLNAPIIRRSLRKRVTQRRWSRK